MNRRDPSHTSCDFLEGPDPYVGHHWVKLVKMQQEWKFSPGMNWYFLKKKKDCSSHRLRLSAQNRGMQQIAR